MSMFLTVAFAAASIFHTSLKSSIPARDAMVVAPSTVSLTFTEKVSVPLSSIVILRADSSQIEKLVVKATSNPARIEGAVVSKLAAGKYLIRWKTVSADGHVVRGTFGFAVKPS
ncbi:MAG: copper resistance CopC family protein [Gemmatimonadales bacterium]